MKVILDVPLIADAESGFAVLAFRSGKMAKSDFEDALGAGTYREKGNESPLEKERRADFVRPTSPHRSSVP
jgi:hypothetical protein